MSTAAMKGQEDKRRRNARHSEMKGMEIDELTIETVSTCMESGERECEHPQGQSKQAWGFGHGRKKGKKGWKRENYTFIDLELRSKRQL